MNFKKGVNIYKVLTFVLSGVIVLILLQHHSQYFRDLFPRDPMPKIQKSAPHSKQIKKILQPLRYSILDYFDRDNVGLSIDFDHGVWAIRNIHHYDENGDLLLAQDKQGICGDLTWYVYNQIRPLLNENYLIDFMYVAEASYFPGETSTHLVLRIIDRSVSPKPKVYIIDPSFRKYGEPKYFEDYLYVRPVRTLDYVQKKQKDIVMAVGGGTPVMITGEVLLTLNIYAMEGKLDKYNFSLGIIAKRRHNYSGQVMLMYGLKEGQSVYYEASPEKRIFIKSKVWKKLSQQLRELYLGIRFEEIDHGRELKLTTQSVKAQLSEGGRPELSTQEDALLENAVASGQKVQMAVSLGAA